MDVKFDFVTDFCNELEPAAYKRVVWQAES